MHVCIPDPRNGEGGKTAKLKEKKKKKKIETRVGEREENEAPDLISFLFSGRDKSPVINPR